MKRLSFIFAATCLVSASMAGNAWAQAATSGQSSATQSPLSDQEFFTRASRDGAMEVQISQLAVRKASSPRTRALAQQLLDDHAAANKELAALAANEHEPVVQKAPDSALMERLQSLNGDEFDKAYASAMIGGHQKAIELFDDATHSNDPNVRAFASKTLPTLRHHLQMARAMDTHAPLGTP
ncbi:DUF4142 domain-containing protein [Dyella telluris]|uniref:DUF4142 domain-containing protein n=1 Tax=Dyella telluris TaxID=2763498 RepID=A0A7G8Q5H8_9GAMM|nr:DUF4142 domain-containing protein [Dyella telluris]QNK02036.1 DUF4142 domain-containing protein [Dyella telluris]